MAERKTESTSDPKSHFKCKICQMTFSDIHAYTEHLESKLHIKGIMKQKYGQKYLEAKEMLEEKHSNNNNEPDTINSNEEKTNSHESEKEDSDSDEDDVYTCDVCKKICTGLLNYKLHLSGNKHLKKLKQIKTMKELKNEQMIPNDYKEPDGDLLGQITSKNVYASSDLICEICSVKCTGPEVFKQHCKGEAHKKKEANLRLKKEMESEGMPANTSKEGFEDTYRCDICSKAFNGILPYKQHLESVNHLKQKRNNQSLEKVKDLCITSSNSKLQCKECNKTFNGPAPFEAHLKSSSHRKLQEKKNLYKQLEKDFPEMLKTKLCDDSETDDSDGEAVKPACGICNMIFTGPEVALEHFSSEKHKKALKKKKRIERIKHAKKTDESLKSSSTAKENKIALKEDANGEAECSSDDSFEKLSS